MPNLPYQMFCALCIFWVRSNLRKGKNKRRQIKGVTFTWRWRVLNADRCNGKCLKLFRRHSLREQERKVLTLHGFRVKPRHKVMTWTSLSEGK